MKENREDTDLFIKIEGIKKTNKEIMKRIEEKKNQVIIQHNYSLKISSNYFSTKDHIKKDLFSITKSDTNRSVAEIIDSWIPDSELIRIKDFFNDDIDFTCDSFDDIKRLNDEMARVALKYEIFDCTEQALKVIRNFKENLETLTVYLGEIETLLRDVDDQREKMNKDLNELNEKLYGLITNIANANIAEQERVKKQKEREEKGSKRREEHKNIQKDIEKLSYSELLRIVKEFQKQKSQLTLAGNYEQTIKSWLPNRSFLFLYRGSQHGFSAANFHQYCNNKGETLCIIKSTGGYLFGGYTSISWTNRQGYANDPKAFIFTLTNPYGGSYKFTPNGNNNNHIYDNSGYGPTWGNGHDLYIASDCDKNQNSYSSFPSSYYDNLGRGSNTFTGSRNFQVAEIEVYQVF